MYKDVRDHKMFIPDDAEEEQKFCLSRLPGYLKNRRLRKRWHQFEKDEIKRTAAQLIMRADGIFCDEETRASIVEQMVTSGGKGYLMNHEEDDLHRKYGRHLAQWLINRLTTGAVNNADFMTSAEYYFGLVRDKDPLVTWFEKEQYAQEIPRVISRIQDFAAYITSQIKFSLLIEPGHLRPNLSAFTEQFNELLSFFDNVELSAEETSQRAFDANRLAKARNQKIECIDSSRVILKPLETLTNSKHCANQNYRQASDIFGDPDIPLHHLLDSYGTSDFIHANYVAGGPLLNKFICTQAPMKNTINDFWHLVYQEKAENIFMLCDAVEIDQLGYMGTEATDHCPVYWPAKRNEKRTYGNLVVSNIYTDRDQDPLFTITELHIMPTIPGGDPHTVKHWQWNWQDYQDYHWPLRLLRRSRISKHPTIVHCLDGCGRTGTLVFIEVLLMQLLRGTANYEHPLLTCAVFVRLQRRYAIEHLIEYLYACRVVLHWIEPFITSKFHRFSLGYMFKDSGFIGKFEDNAQSWAQKNLLQ